VPVRRKKLKNIKVVVVDDQTVIREGMVSILSYQSDINVVGQAKDGIEAINICRQAKPDVVLLDLVMPNMDGFHAIPEILNVSPNSKILILTGYSDAEKVSRAIRTGAIGYLLKDSPWDQHMQAIRTVSTGQSYIDSTVAMKVIQEVTAEGKDEERPTEQLTEREKQTLTLIAKGLKNKEIADRLVVHERTIAKYVGNILAKLHLENRTQVALYAINQGLHLSEEDEK